MMHFIYALVFGYAGIGLAMLLYTLASIPEALVDFLAAEFFGQVMYCLAFVLGWPTLLVE